MEALSFAYPEYPWSVEIKGDADGGLIRIRLMSPDGRPTNYGMNVVQSKNRNNNLYSASATKREAIFMAGEWLERSGLRRGRNQNGYEAYRTEGVPDKHQPYYTPPLEQEVVVGEPEIRTTPRPQAVKDGLSQT